MLDPEGPAAVILVWSSVSVNSGMVIPIRRPNATNPSAEALGFKSGKKPVKSASSARYRLSKFSTLPYTLCFRGIVVTHGIPVSVHSLQGGRPDSSSEPVPAPRRMHLHLRVLQASQLTCVRFRCEAGTRRFAFMYSRCCCARERPSGWEEWDTNAGGAVPPGGNTAGTCSGGTVGADEITGSGPSCGKDSCRGNLGVDDVWRAPSPGGWCGRLEAQACSSDAKSLVCWG